MLLIDPPVGLFSPREKLVDWVNRLQGMDVSGADAKEAVARALERARRLLEEHDAREKA